MSRRYRRCCRGRCCRLDPSDRRFRPPPVSPACLRRFASAYYVWTTGKTRAFPNGFNMIARASNPKARQKWTCEAPQPCERDDCTTTSTKFPGNACAVLEVSFIFPTCWDGVNIKSADSACPALAVLDYALAPLLPRSSPPHIRASRTDRHEGRL